MRLLIALGGNAMTGPDGQAGPEDQRTAIAAAMATVAALVVAGHGIVLTHGNGPQVGNLLLKNELAADIVPPVPLDWCGAQTQATIGMLALNALDGSLAARGSSTRSATLVSRTLVDRDDPAFKRPTKPIGRYLPDDEAQLMIEHGQHWVDRGVRGWRRVVASPEPRACLDVAAAATLLDDGWVVVCAGGGGIPTVYDPEQGYVGVEAVVDKDLTAALLAEQLSADRLVIATDVDAAVVGWETPQARSLGQVGVTELRKLATEGHFASGSMGPKVEAAYRFVERTGRPSAITSLGRIAEAVDGKAGTVVVPDER